MIGMMLGNLWKYLDRQCRKLRDKGGEGKYYIRSGVLQGGCPRQRTVPALFVPGQVYVHVITPLRFLIREIRKSHFTLLIAS